MQRSGFTIIEVLLAALVLIIAWVGISSLAFDIYRKSEQPQEIEAASVLATERLQYFRSQRDPYRAAGGTYYAPSEDPREPDYNRIAAINNNFNTGPYLFVREFIYSTTEGRHRAGATDRGRIHQDRDVSIDSINKPNNGFDFARNEIPPTDASWDFVIPNNDEVAAGAAGLTAAPITPAGSTRIFQRGVAPRANDHLRPGSPLESSIRFVREVWIQTNHPYVTGGSLAWASAHPITGAHAAWLQAPTQARNLPPFTVAVTVRVFTRDRRTVSFDPTAATRQGDGSGPAYESRKPIAQVIGYFAVRRILR